MSSSSEVPGYRFQPNDEELVGYYLRNKVLSHDSLVQAIAEIENICQFEPWELPRFSRIQTNDPVWYFFYLPSYIKGNNIIRRTTNGGFWKPTGKARRIKARDTDEDIGIKRTLVFYEGRFNNKVRSNWVLHEYRLSTVVPNQRDVVLCKLKNKGGAREGEQLPFQYHRSGSHASDANNSIDMLQVQITINEMMRELQVSDMPSDQNRPSSNGNDGVAADKSPEDRVTFEENLNQLDQFRAEWLQELSSRHL